MAPPVVFRTPFPENCSYKASFFLTFSFYLIYVFSENFV